MTISSENNQISYTGNGTTTAFSFPYAFQGEGDLVVIETVIATGVQTTKTLTTDYTVSGTADAQGFFPDGGTVTAVTAPASTVTWTIFNDPDATQTLDLVENDPLPAESLEAALDRLTMIAQRLKKVVQRSIRQPTGDTTDIDVLPAKVVRASKYLAFDADGDPVASAAPEGGNVVSTFMATVLDDTDAATARTTIGAAASATTFTAGNGLTGGGDASANRTFAVGAGTGISVAADAVSLDPAYLRGYLSGLTLSNNATDANNDIDIAAGVAADSTNAYLMKLASGITKRLDAAWTVGTNQGGLDTGTKANSTWYHVWEIARSDTGVVDVLFSTSATAPTMPTDYNYKRRIGAVKTDGSGNILAFKQVEETFYWGALPQDVNVSNLSTTATLYVLSVPTGVKVRPLLRAIHSSGTAVATITSPDEPSSTPNTTFTTSPGFDLENTGAAGIESVMPSAFLYTNTSGQIRAHASGTTSLVIYTRGYIDSRGRFD